MPPEPRDSRIDIRLETSLKELVDTEARRRGMTATTFVRWSLIRATGWESSDE